MMKMRVWVALLLATMSGTSVRADLINDTYVISAFSFGTDPSTGGDLFAALTSGYRGTFDGLEEMVGSNPLGNPGDQLVILEDLQQGLVGNRLTRQVTLILAARNSDGDFTDLLGGDVDTILGAAATGVFIDLGFTNDPITGQTDPLSALIPFATDYTLDAAVSNIFIGSDTFAMDFASAPTFDDGLHFAGTSGIGSPSGLAQIGVFGLSQTYVYSATVPEPSSFAAIGVLGLGGLVYKRRKRKSAATQQA